MPLKFFSGMIVALKIMVTLPVTAAKVRRWLLKVTLSRKKFIFF